MLLENMLKEKGKDIKYKIQHIVHYFGIFRSFESERTNNLKYTYQRFIPV